MLDEMFTMNITPSVGDASSDNYYMSSTFWQSKSQAYTRNVYIWATDIYEGFEGNVPDWNVSYSQVFNANLVLEGLDKIEHGSSDLQAFNDLKGRAYFYRAFAFFNIAQIFAPAYDSAKANTELGIPIILSADVNLPTTRSSVKETYEQMFADLSEAQRLLNVQIPVTNKNRPSKPACLALKARIYLSVRAYDKAGAYADSCLQLYSNLVNFNTVPSSATRYTPFNFLNNPEVMYNSYQNSSTAMSGQILGDLSTSTQTNIDSGLYRSYSTNDLRKTIFSHTTSAGTTRLNGSYAGNYQPFSGLATNEIFLIRAECFARSGNTNLAMADLNKVLINRWKTNSFIPFTASNSSNALNQILTERRKELPFSSVRWSDLRRLNKEGYNITLTRVLNGQTYTLLPNDARYTLPIPLNVIRLAGIQQNKR